MEAGREAKAEVEWEDNSALRIQDSALWREGGGLKRG
jgi:hypothetical protein